jgi:hypothetical protein
MIYLCAKYKFRLKITVKKYFLKKFNEKIFENKIKESNI